MGTDVSLPNWLELVFCTSSVVLENRSSMVHNVFANAVLGADNRWSKLDSKQLHTWTPAIGRIFRANLANELTKDLGLELSRPKDRNGNTQSWFSISGVPKGTGRR